MARIRGYNLKARKEEPIMNIYIKKSIKIAVAVTAAVLMFLV